MSVEDRVRAATRARADLVRDVRPLELRDDHRSRTDARDRTRAARVAPLAVAAAVLLLVAGQLLVRHALGPHAAATSSASASRYLASASVPRYYVALTVPKGTPAGEQATATKHAVVGDDRTGRTLTVIDPPAGQTFTGVTAAANDRTFILTSSYSAQKKASWFLLRLTPGSRYPAELSSLPVRPPASAVTSAALSPDGSRLAVTAGTTRLRQLLLYSVSSGALLDRWQTAGDYWWAGNAYVSQYGDLAWTADGRRVTFRFDDITAAGRQLTQVRALDVTAAGHDLVGGSKRVLQLPPDKNEGAAVLVSCWATLTTPDGGSVVCGNWTLPAGAESKSNACPAVPPSLTGYSAATGKAAGVLYRYAGQCHRGVAVPLWSDSAARDVLGLVLAIASNGTRHYEFGLIAGGQLTPLPALAVPQAAEGSLTRPAGGAIAF